ncbi:MAG: CRISPR-associated endoribonuclease Cas6, partial [Desulfitobacteriaceae bacterium]|nr:CRISPR-associated endoribonuclease Cas6 [Desulfitobacteriaceae bacterium]
ISLRFADEQSVPIHYNYWLQSALYAAMDKGMGARVHDTGFEGSGRIFRYFTFSRLLGLFELAKDRQFIRFPQGCQWVVSSPLNDVLGAMAGGFLQSGVLEIGPVRAEITEVRVEHPVIGAAAVRTQGSDRIVGDQTIGVRVRTLSPVVSYSTMLKGDGSKYTVYFQPGEPEFQRIVAENLQKKWVGLQNLGNGSERDVTATVAAADAVRAAGAGAVDVKLGKRSLGLPADEDGEMSEDATYRDIRIRALGRTQLHIIPYKGGIIKGYSGNLELLGSQSQLQLAVDAGLGSKNAQGFGCLEVMGKV